MALWIKNPLAILADGAGGGLVVEGTRIVELVPAGKQPQHPFTATFDADRHVVLPGLINTHHHFYQTLTRAVPGAIGEELFGWLTTLYPIWARLTPEALRLGVRVAMAELMLSGCTTTTDHHYVFPGGLEDAVDIEVEEARSLGLRVVLTRGSMNLSVADGGLPPEAVVQDHDTILADSQRVIDAHHERGEGAMVQIALAPCSPFSVTRGLMADTARLAEREGVLLHTHLAETADEEAFCLETFGHRPLDYLDDVGWLNDRVWLAHGIHFDDGELSRLAKAGTAITHCPCSNMVLASGQCRVLEMEQVGGIVGLGVDGSASQDASNLIQEVRQALLIQRLQYGAAKVDHRAALRWGTEGSAACLRRPDLGSITVGKQADLAMFTLDELRFSGHGDPMAALVHCGAHRADRVMVAGRWTVEDGAIPGLDIRSLMEAHQAAAWTLQGH